MFDDSVTRYPASGNPLHGEYRGLPGVEDFQKLLEDGGTGVDDVVWEGGRRKARGQRLR